MINRTLQRRQVMGGMGAVLVASSTRRAIASPNLGVDIEQRLGELQNDGA